MHHSTTPRCILLALLPLLAACGVPADEQPATAVQPADAVQLAPEQEQFWAALEDLCGQAFEGRLAEAPPGDTTFADKRLVMHVRECSAEAIRIPFHVGEDRSRTWVLTRTTHGIRLKHDHRHEDGTDDEITMYGGDTAMPGTAGRQEFPADEHTARLVPAAATNIWTVEVVPGTMFAYALRREGTDRRIRIEFDLSESVPVPPAPWGSGD
jgi:hypothetical protein